MDLFQKFNRVYAKAKHYCSSFVIDPHSLRFIRYNKSIWRDYKNKNPQGIVLFYYFDIPSALISGSYFTNLLVKKHNAQIVAFSSTRKGFPWGIFYWKRDMVYRSFNTQKIIGTVLDRSQELRKQHIYQDIIKGIKTKKDVYDIKVDGVWIGVDIYETYLRICRKPTVDLDDPRLFRMIKEGVGIYLFWRDYVAKNQVKAIVVSHDAYIYENILCKIGYKNNIPVYMPNIRGLWFAKTVYSATNPLFKNYRAMFRRLSLQEQAKSLELAKCQLQRRLAGETGVDMAYSLKSAFSLPNKSEQVLRKSDKIKVLICSHCFYDNPQAYGEMLFIDFYDWLCFLGKISQETDYDWYIKMHPDPLPGTDQIIREIIAKYPKITFIPPETSHLQLVSEGINFVLTAYGSVGHELAMLGVQVINAGYNPHSAYDFNWHPQSLAEYENYLLHLDQLKKEISKEDVYEFYYMHYYYTIADGLFLKSYRQYITESTKNQEPGIVVYEHFLKDINRQKHQEICTSLLQFIESGKNYYLSRGLEN
ncbi:MAG: hypothetical protein HY209_00450 [Candidatus Omnitrophica bacterium]|nr:hypothetical protein [Candidatus Omnitrophota bacterium]